MERSRLPIKFAVENGNITWNGQNPFLVFKSSYVPSEAVDAMTISLSNVKGQWTKEIGVLQGNLDVYDRDTLEQRVGPENFRSAKRRIIMQNNNTAVLESALLSSDTSLQDPKLIALESLYRQFVQNNTINISQDDFIKLYKDRVVFSNGVLVVKGSDNSYIPPPISIEGPDGELVFEIQDAEKWKRLDFADKIFDHLVTSGKERPDGRNTFLETYSDRLGTSNGVLEDQTTSLTLDGESLGSYGSINDNPIYNPLETIESKLSTVPPDVFAPSEMEQAQTSAIIPGSNGFYPNGQQLNVMLIQNTWYLTFENAERDTYPKQRNLGGMTILGHWTGSSPLSNAGPTGILDSYFMAYHMQRRHNTDSARNFLLARIQKALSIGSINATKDIVEFEVATRCLDLPDSSDIFDIEQMQDTFSCTLEACLQRNWNQVAQGSKWGEATLPSKIDETKLRSIPPFQSGQPLLKRTIEAAGILNDVQVQNKLRKVYGDFIEAREFSKNYMDLIQQANQGEILPHMDRIEMEGRIARDETQEIVSREMVRLLYTPLVDFFKI